MNPSTLVPSPEKPNVAHEVILVHGTFASSEEDCGQAWWQVGSSAYQALQKRLPRKTQLAGPGRMFRWSGENSERARSKAAAKLLDFVAPLEEAGTPYHLIGHSHGGSVIWSALQLAAVRRKELQHLGSWSTVGTPFLHHQARSPWSVINLAYAVLASLLLYPALHTFGFLVVLPYDLAVGGLPNGIVIKDAEHASAVSKVLRAPVLEAVELLGVQLTHTGDGIRLGSFDPASGQSLGWFLFGSFEGWVIVAGILLFTYCTILLCSYCVGPVAEVARSVWEKRLKAKVFETYGDRWLGLWTRDDEAINGLRTTLELSMSFVAKLVPRERIFISDLVSIPSRPLSWAALPIFNRFLRPAFDAVIRSAIVKAAQGNNRPAAKVVAVSPHPILADPDSLVSASPPLPEWLSDKILTQADLHASNLGPKLRRLLGAASFAAKLDGLNTDLAGRELVHTSYFDHPEVIELLALNIASAGPRSAMRRVCPDVRLSDWYTELKQAQQLLLNHDPAPVGDVSGTRDGNRRMAA